MADFIPHKEEEDLQEGQEQVFSSGDKQYTQEELDKLVGLGETAVELEDKWNTKIDKLYSGFTQKSQAVKEYETEIGELKGKLEEQTKPEVPQDEAESIRQAKEAARKIGIVLEDDLDTLGYVKKDDYVTLYQQQRAGEKILETAQSLSKEIDGTDGRPAFEIEEMLEYMKENNIGDPNLAYRIKNEEALDAWKESKYAEAKKPGLNTLEKSTAGGREPAKVKATKDNLSKLVSQALDGKI